jgi:hypothetical protein
MSSWQQTDGHGVPKDGVEAPVGVVQIRLEELGKRSWRSALFSAVIGTGGGPLYRFVAADADTEDEGGEHAVVSANFPLQPFQDLEGNTDDGWAELARRRLRELDAELQRQGWRRIAERGPHWWSLRYER